MSFYIFIYFIKRFLYSLYIYKQRNSLTYSSLDYIAVKEIQHLVKKNQLLGQKKPTFGQEKPTFGQENLTRSKKPNFRSRKPNSVKETQLLVKKTRLPVKESQHYIFLTEITVERFASIKLIHYLCQRYKHIFHLSV